MICQANLLMNILFLDLHDLFSFIISIHIKFSVFFSSLAIYFKKSYFRIVFLDIHHLLLISPDFGSGMMMPLLYLLIFELEQQFQCRMIDLFSKKHLPLKSPDFGSGMMMPLFYHLILEVEQQFQC